MYAESTRIWPGCPQDVIDQTETVNIQDRDETETLNPQMLIARVPQLRCYIEKLQNLSHLNWSPNSQNLNAVGNIVSKILQEGVQNMHHWSGAIDDAADRWLPQW